jgi:hypothetical protein
MRVACDRVGIRSVVDSRLGGSLALPSAPSAPAFLCVPSAQSVVLGSSPCSRIVSIASHTPRAGSEPDQGRQKSFLDKYLCGISTPPPSRSKGLGCQNGGRAVRGTLRVTCNYNIGTYDYGRHCGHGTPTGRGVGLGMYPGRRPSLSLPFGKLTPGGLALGYPMRAPLGRPAIETRTGCGVTHEWEGEAPAEPRGEYDPTARREPRPPEVLARTVRTARRAACRAA